jgi:hypothetical protein
MKSCQARLSDGLGVRGRSLLDRSPRWRVAESSVHAVVIVVLDELEEEPSEVILVEWDDVIE